MTVTRPLLLQVKRMLALEDVPAAGIDAAKAIAENPQPFAAALFAEAVASDDVASADAAVSYLEDRLAAFAEIVPPGVAPLIRAEFNRLLAAWAQII